MPDIEIDKYKDLVQSALRCRQHAYAPYSDFLVGAALRTASGHVFVGCNVENISFGLTMCAERVCVGAAIAAGERELEVIAVVADTDDPVLPCGACRQVLAEFNPELLVLTCNLAGVSQLYPLSELLPKSKQGILQRSARST